MRHDCVVVPGLGAFLVNETPAHYDSVAECFIPPMRTLGFNPEVCHNDGLLASSIARKEEISIESAQRELATMVSALNHQLEVTGEYPLGNLGILRKNASVATPIFEPSSYSLSSLRYAGLKSVAITPLCQVKHDEDETVMDTPRVVYFPTPLKIVASFIILMVAFGIIYSTTGLVHSPELKFASLDTSLNIHVDSPLNTNAQGDSAIQPALSREIILNIAYPVADIDETTITEKSDMGLVDPDRYILVVASFPTQKAAEKHIQYLNSTSALRIIEMDSNFRVYAASASNIDEARQKAEHLKAQFPSVWVCKR